MRVIKTRSPRLLEKWAKLEDGRTIRTALNGIRWWPNGALLTRKERRKFIAALSEYETVMAVSPFDEDAPVVEIAPVKVEEDR